MSATPGQTVHALVWWSAAGAALGTPWWVLELSDPDSPPKRCCEVKWFGGTARTVYREAGFPDIPDGPRGVVELHVAELQLIRPAGENEA